MEKDISMTQEEKQLLFKDLCARLPYGVVIHTDWKDIKLDHDHCGIGMLYYEHYSEETKKECSYDENDCSIIISGCYYGDIKPYLRPMSSMTKEEENEYLKIVDGFLNFENVPRVVDWLNAHHFDYHQVPDGKTMIEAGLALKAPEDMYK